MRKFAYFIFIFIPTHIFGVLNAQSQIDYITPILEIDSVGNKIYAAKHDSEIVFVTNGLCHDSLITEWCGFNIRYVEKDSLYLYIIKSGSPKFVFEITKVTVTAGSLFVKYYIYTACKNRKQNNLFMSMLASSSIVVGRERKQ
jgi:hypothetical protein